MENLQRAPARPSRVVAAALALALTLLTGLAPVRPAVIVAAGTAETMEAKLVSLINVERTARGLVPIRLHTKLATLAGDRATALAALGVLNHTAPGCLKCQLAQRSIQWYSFGEVLASTSRTWGDEAARSLFDAWKGSPGHWAILMSRSFNYLGVGVAYRSANRMTYGAIVATESIDQSWPWARLFSGSAKSGTVTWAWTGGDTPLQTHTSGLKSFDVQYRVDSGSFSTIRSGTTSTSLSLAGRSKGHWYGIRIRSRDHRGYVSPWTTELRVWVP